MLRVRRLASIAVVAGLGLAALSGCRSDPAVAAYVGSERIMEARVDGIVEELFADLNEEQRGSIDEGYLRDQVVHFLVLNEVVGQYADSHDIEVPAVDPRQFAEAQGLPPDTEFTEVAAQYNAALTAVAQAAEPQAPSPADRREAFDHATVQNQPLSQLAQYDQVEQYFNEEALGRTLGMREILNAAVNDADVKVNPRYDATYQLPVQIQDARSWFAVQLDRTVPVRDAPPPPVELPAPGQEQSDQG